VRVACDFPGFPFLAKRNHPLVRLEKSRLKAVPDI
jgi:hypothetical protein